MTEIVFLDDDRTFLNSLERYFMKVNLEWATHFFSEQQLALDTLERSRAAVWVLDWSMPGMDGMTCAARARESARNNGNRIHIIMLTGHMGIDDTVSALELGADDYITKPVDLHDLKLHIELGLEALAT